MRLRQVLNAAYRATRTGTASPAHPGRPALTDIPGFPGVNRQRVCAARTRSTRLVAMPAASTTLRCSPCRSSRRSRSPAVRHSRTPESPWAAPNSSTTSPPGSTSLELTYSADYQLPGGQSAAIAQAQDPARPRTPTRAGNSPSPRTAITTCTTTGARPTCTLIAPPTPGSKPTVTLFGEANQQGLVTPPVVVGLLTAAALDPQAVIKQSDTTVAGHHAACVGGGELVPATSPPASPPRACSAASPGRSTASRWSWH